LGFVGKDVDRLRPRGLARQLLSAYRVARSLSGRGAKRGVTGEAVSVILRGMPAGQGADLLANEFVDAITNASGGYEG